MFLAKFPYYESKFWDLVPLRILPPPCYSRISNKGVVNSKGYLWPPEATEMFVVFLDKFLKQIWYPFDFLPPVPPCYSMISNRGGGKFYWRMMGLVSW